MRRISGIVLPCVLLTTIAAFTQTNPASDPNVITAAAIAAFASHPVLSVQLSGTVHAIAGSTDETGSFTFKEQSTGESTLSLSMYTLSRTETTGASSGAPQCTWSGVDGVQHSVAEHNCHVSLNWMLPVLSLQAQNAVLQKAANTGTGPDGSPNQELTVNADATNLSSAANAMLHESSMARLALDPKTYLPVSLSFNVHPDKNELLNIPIVVRYSDYRQISGATIPFHIQRYLNNGLAFDLHVEKASVQ